MIRRVAGLLRRPPQPQPPTPAAPKPAPAPVNGGQGIPVNPPRVLPPIPVPATNPARSDTPPRELTDAEWHAQERAILDQLAYETDRTGPLTAANTIFGGPADAEGDG